MVERPSLTIAVAIVAYSFLQHAVAETFESLAARLPRETNALVLIDVEQTLQAPLAREQGWARKLEAAYASRPVYLPPEAKKLALGAALRPSDDFLPAWELAVMELAEPVGIRAIARAESGYVDELNGVQAAMAPDDVAFISLSDAVLAAARPADRQFLSRWVLYARDNTQPQLSNYLQSALSLVNERVQVLLAIDLTDVLGRRQIEAKLAESPALKGKQADAAAIADVIAKLQGAALRLAVGNECRAQLQIDFGADVAPLKNVAKPLVFEALGSLGFQTKPLEGWSLTLGPRSIRMQGELSADAQRRVFSVIELPSAQLSHANGPTEASPAGAAAPDESEMRESSLAYFKSTQTLVDDLRKGLKDAKATSAWMERYARRIDELPVLNVDELLLDYGDKLAETLRIMALSKRQAGIQYGVRATEGAGYYSGYSYGEDAYSSAAARSQARKEEMAVASSARVEGWRLIDDATADIRRTLTKKYATEF
jgi:hypothetical protein